MGLGMPIPDLSNKPGPGRPGWGPAGAYEFQFEVDGQVTFKADAAAGGGSFTVKWPNGSSQSYSGNNSSITAPDATAGIVSINNKLDSGYCDEFAVTGGKDKVKKVISWGERPWRDLSNGFNACTNLTNIENTKLIGGANCNLTSLFINCTGLTDALCENWDLSSGCSIIYLFQGCTNLELLNLTGSKFATTGNSSYAFNNVGSATTNGCEFKMAGLDFTGSTVNNAGMYWFKLSKFKDGSNLSNWTFDSALNSFRGNEMFNNSIVNGTLDLSNWAWPNQEFPSFSNINTSLTSQNGSKIKLSNWDVSVVNNFAQKFGSCNVYELEGLSTWSACAGNASTFRMFSGAYLMRIKPNDNFSNAFMASLTPTYVNEMFRNFSRDLLDAERGPCPNLNGLNLSNLTAPTVNGLIDFMNNSHFTNTPDFSNVTFSSTNTVNFNRAFYQFDTIGTGSDSIFNFNPIAVKPANFTSTFYWAHGLSEVNIGSNVNMSSTDNFNDMFRLINYSTAAATFTNVTFPTNADFSSLTGMSRTFEDSTSPNQFMSVCQMDNFIRRLKATNNNSNLTVNFYANKVTEAPSVVRSDVDYLENTKGWNITLATPDATLPFAYPAYMVDPSSTTSLTPSLLPPVADRNFTSTNSSITVDQTTGVLSWASNFEGFTTVRCTYANGCYNEVNVGVQVPTVLRRLIPAAGQTASFNLRGSQYIDWGDGTAEANSGNASHAYAAAGTGWGTWRTIKIFDKSATEKFTGFNGTSSANFDRIDIMQWGSQVFDGLSFNYFNALGLRAPSNNPVNTTLLTSFYRMFRIESGYKANARFADPNNNLGSWKTSTATGGGAITSVEEMFSGVSMLGCSLLDDHSDLTWSFPAGTTATAGTYTGTIYGRRQSGTYVDYSIRWLVKVEGSGTVTLDNNNFKAIPNYMYMGRELSVGDVIRIEANAFGSLNNAITLTLTSDNILNVNQNPGNLNNWDTSQITNFHEMFSRSSQLGGNRRLNMNFSNWNLSNAEDISFFVGTDGNNAGLITGVNDISPKLVSAADSPTGSSYVAWDTSNLTNISKFNYLGSNALGVLKYWRFNTTNNVSLSGLFFKINLQPYASDEPCKTQVILAGDSNNPYGVNYTAWNMEKVSSVSNFARRDGVNNQSITALTPALSSWQITDVLTSFNTMSYAYDGNYTFSPTVGHWDISGLTGSNTWQYHRAGTFKFSTSAYDNLLDITNGWGAHASTVNSGVNLGMGTSQYTPGNVYEGGQGLNTYQNNKIYNGGVDLRIYTSVGDVVERDPDPNGVYDTYAIITGYDAGGVRATTQGNIGPANYKVMDSDAAKGRVALINAGWDITDGGAYIPFNSVEMTINVSAGDTFSITPQNSPNNFKVDWGDGNGFVGDPNNGGANYTGSGFTATSPAYTSGGNKTVKICEDSSQYIHSLSQNYNGPSAGDRSKIINMVHWGSNPWKTLYRTFFDCDNLVMNTTTTPNLANGPSLSGMFYRSAGDFTNSNIGNWNMSSITTVDGMFQETTSFNVDISGWDVGNVTNFTGFMRNNSVFNQDISNWDTSKVTNFYLAFQGCSSLNADLNTKDTGSRLAWDVSNVTSFHGMLSGTTSMTYDIDKWQITTDPSKNVTMANMFTGQVNWMTMEPKTVTVGSGAYQKTYLAWDTQRVNNMAEMFHANNVFNKDIGKWDTSNVTNMYRTFRYATSFNNGGQPINTRSVTVGTGATARTYTAWDVSNVTNFERGPFENNQAFNQDVSNWDVSNAANALVRGFENAQVFNHYLPWNLNTSANPPSTYYLYNMFNGSGMSTNNYTDTIVYWANFVKNQTPDAPLNVNMNAQGGMTFDSNRSGGSNFANAFAAREFLTNTVANGGAGWTITSDTILPLLVSSTNSLSFNGSTEHVATTFTATGLTAMTISAYVYLDEEWESRGAITGSNWAPNDMFGFHINSDRKLDVFIRNGGANPQYLTANTAMSLGQWHHVAITVSNNGTNNDITFYLNGSVDNTTGSTQAYGQGQNFSSTTATPYNIGNINQVGSQTNFSHFKGRMDEVMIWDNVISSSNITTLANAVGSGNVPDPNALASGVQLWNRMGD